MSGKYNEYYNRLQQAGINMPTKEEFNAYMDTDSGRRGLYQRLQNGGYLSKNVSYEQWGKNLPKLDKSTRRKTSSNPYELKALEREAEQGTLPTFEEWQKMTPYERSLNQQQLAEYEKQRAWAESQGREWIPSDAENLANETTWQSNKVSLWDKPKKETTYQDRVATRNLSMWRTETEEAGRNKRAKEKQEFDQKIADQRNETTLKAATIRGRSGSGGGSSGKPYGTFMGRPIMNQKDWEYEIYTSATEDEITKATERTGMMSKRINYTKLRSLVEDRLNKK